MRHTRSVWSVLVDLNRPISEYNFSGFIRVLGVEKAVSPLHTARLTYEHDNTSKSSLFEVHVERSGTPFDHSGVYAGTVGTKHLYVERVA